MSTRVSTFIQGILLLFLNHSCQRRARTQSPTTLNHAVRFPAFGEITEVNKPAVQGLNLPLGEPVSWSWYFLCQVSSSYFFPAPNMALDAFTIRTLSLCISPHLFHYPPHLFSHATQALQKAYKNSNKFSGRIYATGEVAPQELYHFSVRFT